MPLYFTIEAMESSFAWLKKDQRVFSVGFAIVYGALMPRSTSLYSQTNTQYCHILLQLFLSQYGTDITNCHVLILLCHVLPNHILCHFFFIFSSSYIIIFCSYNKL